MLVKNYRRIRIRIVVMLFLQEFHKRIIRKRIKILKLLRLKTKKNKKLLVIVKNKIKRIRKY